MNHDEKNSNPNPEMRTYIEPELEARVVAWVAGEASAFEIAELERLIAEKPELAIFKRRIEAVHGLIAEAVLPEKEPLRLSAERRAKVMMAIGATDPASRRKPMSVVGGEKTRRRTARSWAGTYWAVGLAASIAIGVFMLPVSLEKKPARPDEQRRVSMVAMPSAEPAEAPSTEKALSDTKLTRDLGGLAQVKNEEAAKKRGSEIALRRESGAGQGQPRVSRGMAAGFDAPADPVVKLDAFTVSGPRAGGYATVELGAAAEVTTAPAMQTLEANRLQRVDKSALMLGSSGRLAQQEGLARSNSILANDGDVTANANTASNLRAFRSEAFAFNDSIVPAPAAPPPVTFGERVGERAQAKPAGSADPFSVTLGASTMVGGIAGAVPASREPPANEPLTLSAFVVQSPKQKDENPGGAGLGDKKTGSDSDTKLVAKLSGTKEEQENKPREQSVRPSAPPANDETSAAQEPVSTFSLHVSDVSFRLAVAATAAIERGENPKMPEIRAEEFYNAFSYDDPSPTMAEKVAARIEQSSHPVLQQRNLLRIAIKVPATGRGAGQPLRLTVLLDTSGSMEREDRRLSVRRALEELIKLLGPNDRVTLIGFARQPRLLAENVAGNQAAHLVELSARTPAEGGTNLEEALKLASELALRHRLEQAQNRIVLLTDGAANLGNADPAQLATMVESLRQRGIAFDACGIGLEGIGDAILEALTRKGDGRYYVVDRPEAADAAFARQLAGAFRPAAENVKLQVRFNAARVGRYRLIGFEQHRLREQDFRNDKVDAAELAAEEGANALYQIETLPQGSGEVGEVFVRFRDAATGAMVERSWTIGYDAHAPRFDRATSSLQLAGLAALVAEKVGHTPLAAQFKLGDFAGVVNAIRGHYANEPRVQELATMFGRLRRMNGE